MPFGDREVWIIKPTSAVDDVSGLPLDPEKTWVGMQKEVAAMRSLGVGNVRNYQEIKAHCDEIGLFPLTRLMLINGTSCVHVWLRKILPSTSLPR